MFTINDVKFKNILHINNLSLEAGSIYCLFGKSGSGKSTLLKMFNGMLTPDKGQLRYKEEQITTLDPIQLRREVVMLGQDPVVFEGTVRDNLLMGLRFSDQEEVADSKLFSLLNELQLNKELDEDANNLSGGEKQRIAFGRVILMNAEVYLMDEPTSALDEKTELTVMDYFIQLIRKNKKTAIMVTHSKEIAEKYSNHLIYMDDILTKDGDHHE